MNAVELLRRTAPSIRSAQDAIAESIERFLAGEQPVGCVNAETGVGKTLAYGAPVVLAARARRKVVVSTHTTQQLEQVLAAMNRLAAELPAPVAVARRLGRANFLSPARIARILANKDDLDEDGRALLKEARAHAGPIDEFEAAYGPLPVARSDVCLTSSCRHQDAWERQRVNAEDADIVVQTHAMSVLDAVRGEVRADIAVYDEGDALPSAAAGFAEARVTPLDLIAVRERHEPPGLAAAAAAFEAWAEGAVGEEGVAFKESAAESVEHAKAVRHALAGVDAEDSRDIRRALSAFVNLDSSRPWRGAAVVAAPQGHAFEVLALEPGRVLSRTYDGRKTLFVGATLAFGSESFEPFLRSVGAHRFAGASGPRAEVVDFGAMAFALADRAVPPPFGEGGKRASAFDDYAAGMVRAAAAEGGRVLVLAPSFADVDELASRVPEVLAHRRGGSLSACLDRFKSVPNGVLVTPAAWAGTDLPGLLDHVVILRVPFPPPEAGRTELLHRLLQSRGYGGANAEAILRRRNYREALRRLAQGFGRGIRTPEDRVKVWIADPRFPLPDTFVLNPRLLTGQGHAERHRGLAQAIPPRFAGAWEEAKIFPNGSYPAAVR